MKQTLAHLPRLIVVRVIRLYQKVLSFDHGFLRQSGGKMSVSYVNFFKFSCPVFIHYDFRKWHYIPKPDIYIRHVGKYSRNILTYPPHGYITLFADGYYLGIFAPI